jgi:hypothetical protein
MNLKISIIGTSLLLAACSMGPWNTQVGESTAHLPRVTLANLIVAGKAYDTMWITRSVSFDAKYDSSRIFVDTAKSWVRVIRLDGVGAPDTIPYALGRPLAVAWLPTKADTAAHGSRYRLEAHLRWDTASAFCAGEIAPEWTVSDFSAETYTPSIYHLGQISAPAEALLPAVAAAGKSGLAAYTTGSDSLTRWGFGQAAMDSIANGSPVYRHVKNGDSVWYIRSDESCIAFNGAPNIRQNRPYLVSQTIDKRSFGGLLERQRFDSTRSRILDPITQRLQNSTGQKFDSTRYYQRGQWRFVDFMESYQMDLPGWPDSLQLKNLDIGYTGLNVFYEYSMDSLYSPYINGLGGGLKLPFTNIRGGATGYFSGAAVDSVRLFVLSPTVDTFQVQSLRGAWCRRRLKRNNDSLQTIQPDSAEAIWIRTRPQQCFDIQ